MESASLEEFQDISQLETKKIEKDSAMFSDDDEDDINTKHILKKVVKELMSDEETVNSTNSITKTDNESHSSQSSNSSHARTMNTFDGGEKSSKSDSNSSASRPFNSSNDSYDEFGVKEFASQEELQSSLKTSTAVNTPSKTEASLSQSERKTKKRSSWIQCDRPDCQKWRRLDHIDDMNMVSDGKWICCMNEGEKYNDCDCTQETIPSESEDESAYTSFKPGALVLGKMAGYPWWPGIVEDDPDFDSFFYLDKKKEKTMVHYHVTFLGKDVSRAWLTEVAVTNFDGHETLADLGTLSYRGKNFGRAVTSALKEAKNAMEYSTEKRVRKYGFLRRYKGKDRPLEDTAKLEHDKKITKRELKNLKEDDGRKKEARKTSVQNRENTVHLGKPTARKLKEFESSKKERKRLKKEKKKRKLSEEQKQLKNIASTLNHSATSSKPDNPINASTTIDCPNNASTSLDCPNNASTSLDKQPNDEHVSKEDGVKNSQEIDTSSLSKSADCKHISNGIAKNEKIENDSNVRTYAENLVNTDENTKPEFKNLTPQESSQELTENQKHAEAMVNKYIDQQTLDNVIKNVDPSKVKTKTPKVKKEKTIKDLKPGENNNKKKKISETDKVCKKAKGLDENQEKGKRKEPKLKKSKLSDSKDNLKIPLFKEKNKSVHKKEIAPQKTDTESAQLSLDQSKSKLPVDQIKEKEQDKDVSKNEKQVHSKCQQEENVEVEIPNKDLDAPEKKCADPVTKAKKLENKNKKSDEELKEKNIDQDEIGNIESKESVPSVKHIYTDDDLHKQPVSVKKEKIPKLVKPTLPLISTDEIMKKKDKTSVPKLKKPSFKAPVRSGGESKKVAPSFSAPKKKTLGVKRPNICTTEEEKSLEPSSKRPNVEVELDLNVLLADDKPSEEKENVVLHDSPEF